MRGKHIASSTSDGNQVMEITKHLGTGLQEAVQSLPGLVMEFRPQSYGGRKCGEC